MSLAEIIELATLGVAILGFIFSIVVALVKGKLKDFIIAKMEEAEVKFAGQEDKGKKKFEYVVEEVKKEYKVASLVLNVKEFIEKIIKLSKKINK